MLLATVLAFAAFGVVLWLMAQLNAPVGLTSFLPVAVALAVLAAVRRYAQGRATAA
jgi:hypothetical protein